MCCGNQPGGPLLWPMRPPSPDTLWCLHPLNQYSKPIACQTLPPLLYRRPQRKQQRPGANPAPQSPRCRSSQLCRHATRRHQHLHHPHLPPRLRRALPCRQAHLPSSSKVGQEWLPVMGQLTHPLRQGVDGTGPRATACRVQIMRCHHGRRPPHRCSTYSHAQPILNLPVKLLMPVFSRVRVQGVET
jgi:hypothetical protein